MRISRLIKIVAIAVGILMIAFVSGNFILKSLLEKQLAASLKQFQPYITMGFSKAHINLFTASIRLDSLYVLYNPELKPQRMHEIKSPAALITGINFFKFVIHKKIVAG